MTVSKLVSRITAITPVLLATLVSSCSLSSAHRERACIFDDWAPNETPAGIVQERATWKSPSGKVALACLKSGQDSDLYILVGRSVGQREEAVLGYGIDSIDVKWVQTRAGDVAIVDRRLYAGLNRIYVLKPYQVKNKASWVLLYKTPEFSQTADGLSVSHCHWSFLKSDPDLGSIRLKASWEFSDATASVRNKVTEGVYEVPIFYGFK